MLAFDLAWSTGVCAGRKMWFHQQGLNHVCKVVLMWCIFLPVKSTSTSSYGTHPFFFSVDLCNNNQVGWVAYFMEPFASWRKLCICTKLPFVFKSSFFLGDVWMEQLLSRLHSTCCNHLIFQVGWNSHSSFVLGCFTSKISLLWKLLKERSK